jgi:hypothetical protein
VLTVDELGAGTMAEELETKKLVVVPVASVTEVSDVTL